MEIYSDSVDRLGQVRCGFCFRCFSFTARMTWAKLEIGRGSYSGEPIPSASFESLAELRSLFWDEKVRESQ